MDVQKGRGGFERKVCNSSLDGISLVNHSGLIGIDDIRELLRGLILVLPVAKGICRSSSS